MSIVGLAECAVAIGKASNISDAELGLLNGIKYDVENLVREWLGFNVEIATWTHYLPQQYLAQQSDNLVEGYEVIGARVVPWSRESHWDRRYLQLPEIPLRQIISIYENPAAWTVSSPPDFPASSLLHEGPDYQPDLQEVTSAPNVTPVYGLGWKGHVIRTLPAWQTYDRCIKVTYIAGLTPAELSSRFSSFRRAVVVGVQQAWNEAKAYMPDQVSRGGGVGPITSERLENWSANYGASVDQNFGLVTELPMKSKAILAKWKNWQKIAY